MGDSRTAKEIQNIVDSIHNGVVAVDKDGKITVFNKAMEKIFGIAASDAIGSPIYELIPYTGLLRVLTTGKPHIGRKFNIGEQVYLANRTPIIDGGEVVGAVGVIQDVTEFQAIVDELESVKDLQGTLATVLDAAYEGLLIINNEGYITMVNQAFASLLNASPSHLVGKHVTQVIEDSRMPIVVQTGVPEVGELQRINEQEVIIQRVPIIKDGKTLGAVGKIMFKGVAELNALVSKVSSLNTELAYYKDEVQKYRGARYGLSHIVGESKPMVMLKETIKRIASSNSTILITGETGTGKELVAHAIHMESARRYGPFIQVNCAAIPEHLLESELFGYEEGAFTGARKGGQIGKFQLAHGGTIFLDEIGDMSLSLQAKLLRVLQEREIERLGATKTTQIDVRIIAATNNDLEHLLGKGRFREDLFYRLNVVSLRLPPMRERMEDLELLVKHFCQKFQEEFGSCFEKVSEEVWDAFRAYRWPGNVRELEHVLERAFNVMEDNCITLKDLPLYFQKQAQKAEANPVHHLQTILDEAEREAITEALRVTKGNKVQAAQQLGISRAWLYRLIEKHGL
jgi:PAS domain S-box-containing protein